MSMKKTLLMALLGLLVGAVVAVVERTCVLRVGEHEMAIVAVQREGSEGYVVMGPKTRLVDPRHSVAVIDLRTVHVSYDEAIDGEEL